MYAKLSLSVFIVFLSGCIIVDQTRLPDYNGRWFSVTDSVGVVEFLKSGDDGRVFTMREMDETGDLVTGTLDVWVQHCPRFRCNAPEEAEDADLVFSCYPVVTSDAINTRHVFPYFAGKVWVYEWTYQNTNRSVVYVSMGEEPLLKSLVSITAATSVSLTCNLYCDAKPN